MAGLDITQEELLEVAPCLRMLVETPGSTTRRPGACPPGIWLILDVNSSIICPCRAKKGGSNKLQAPPVTFRDVAGLDTAKEELLEVVACLRDARRYARLNAKTPSGVLLTGPPGTGKTLLGKWLPSHTIVRADCLIFM